MDISSSSFFTFFTIAPLDCFLRNVSTRFFKLSNSSDEFDETTDDEQILATDDRNDQWERWMRHVIDYRRQIVAVSSQNDLQQSRRRRRQRERRRDAGQRRHCRHVDQQQPDDRDADDAELNVSVPMRFVCPTARRRATAAGETS